MSLTFLYAAAMAVPASQSPLRADVADQVNAWAKLGRPTTITEERATDLAPLASWISQKKSKGEPAHLVFVCTHNSRRSQMGQAWAMAAALQLGHDHVQTWSGGTETTAFNPRAVQALKTHGFTIDETGNTRGDGNVEYRIGYGPGLSQVAFSKVYSDAFNPKTGFAAIMVCSAADASCPYVDGAEVRVSVPYLDPKISDGSPAEAATYLAKSEEIAREWTWLMQQVGSSAPSASEP